MQIKNKISSTGNPNNRQPIKYRSLNHQTPMCVNHASHKINIIPTQTLAFKNEKK